MLWNSRHPGLSCAFCRRNDDCPEKYGKKETYDCGITLHYYCLIMSSGLYQRGKENEGIYGFLPVDIKKELHRATKITCNVCRKRGASIGCTVAKCRKSFHFPCGVAKQCIFQFTGQFASYCWEHKPVQKVAPAAKWANSSHACAVCLESIDTLPSYDVLKSPCCKNTWLHRQCVQYQALSAGMFFFRCTICSNKDEFQQEMLRMGIHVPEKDASWELEENAYQELLQRYQRCDVRKCLCKNGREYAETEGKWDIVLCKYCGSSGTHLACSTLVRCLQDWECPECRAIVHKSGMLFWKYLSSNRKRTGHHESVHSSPKCPRLSSETQKETRNRQMFATRPIADILEDLRSQINLKIITTFNVDKNNIWDGYLKKIRYKDLNPASTICVKFLDHDRQREVDDLENPCNEFFSLLLHNLQNSTLFEGSATSKNLNLDSRALRWGRYFEAGRVFAMSIVHGGRSPGFLSTTLFNCLAYGPEMAEPTIEDVKHFDLLQKIGKIKGSSTLEELKMYVKEYADYLSIAGCLRPVWSLGDKEMLVKDMLTFHVINRVRSPFERFREGLKFLGVLENIQKYPEAFVELFCHRPKKLTSEIFEKLFSIKYSQDKKNRNNQESRIIRFWKEYLGEIEGGKAAASFEEILTFATGDNAVPSISFHPNPTIEFMHADGKIQYRFPTAQMRQNCLKLPMSKTYKAFKESMDFAICNTHIPDRD
uniref:G2/M-phase specific E3 ubiquitin protein ligase n=1 Tax=Callorhinchus milii TaxID=7868 RepID=A0A4W3GWM5_CALMI